MRSTQANRARVAERAQPARSQPLGRPSTDLRSRTLTVTEPAVPATRGRKGVRLTATQRNSVGRVSEWNRSPYYFTDPAWGRTVSG
jgi:hypothetical protein